MITRQQSSITALVWCMKTVNFTWSFSAKSQSYELGNKARITALSKHLCQKKNKHSFHKFSWDRHTQREFYSLSWDKELLASLRGAILVALYETQTLWCLCFCACDVNTLLQQPHGKPSPCLPTSWVISESAAVNFLSQNLHVCQDLSMWCKVWAHKASLVLTSWPHTSHHNFLLRWTHTCCFILYLKEAVIKHHLHMNRCNKQSCGP